jgi:retrograde regulation protein 2
MDSALLYPSSRLSESESSDFEELLAPDEIESVQLTSRYATQDSDTDSDTGSDADSDIQPQLGGGHPPWRGHGDQLVGIVDMGSNGIRFSISDQSPPLARIIPTALFYRSSISLYDAQFDNDTGAQVPIPKPVIDAVCKALRRFQIICQDFKVADDKIHVVATEATRLAKNSAQLLAAIKSATGIDVRLLDKHEEGQVGAMGIASGFMAMEGLVMDLGGGSTQISWIISRDGFIRTSPHSAFSFPYGAAALTKKLADIQKGKDKKEAQKAVDEFRKTMIANFKDAYERLEVPDVLKDEAAREGGFRIYLSGGGFRGWGYLLLYLNQTHGHHYPISIINGYTVGREQFADTERVKEIAEAAHDVFRVSDRRRSQVPAVAFLVSALTEAIPLGIKEAHFCQGGVREGYLYKELSPSVRKQAPLEVASRNLVPGNRKSIQRLLEGAIPKPSEDGERRFPLGFGLHVVDAFANVMYVHMFMSKETASTAALYSTSTGIMSSTHGVSHQDRARLALMLQARYRGELPPREMDFRDALRDIISPEDVWWAQYLGRVGYLITCLYPTGLIHASRPKVLFSADWTWNAGKKKNKEGLILTISLESVEHDPSQSRKTLDQYKKKITKAGKKKNWVGTPAWGMKVDVDITEEGIL